MLEQRCRQRVPFGARPPMLRGDGAILFNGTMMRPQDGLSGIMMRAAPSNYGSRSSWPLWKSDFTFSRALLSDDDIAAS